MSSRVPGTGSCSNGTTQIPADSCIPLIAPKEGDTGTLPVNGIQRRAREKNGIKRDISLNKDALFTLWRNGACHIVSESYFYKTGPYYEILRREIEGEKVLPSTSSILDAYIVPVCLERSRLAGIPVCEWGISQGYVPLPAILYGLNYYATASVYRVVSDNEETQDAVRHITNKGKYPFCYQPLADGASIHSCAAIFGRTTGSCREVERIAGAVYDLFMLPLVTIVMVHDRDGYSLSSLSPTRYSRLSADERSLLAAYLSHQEFL